MCSLQQVFIKFLKVLQVIRKFSETYEGPSQTSMMEILQIQLKAKSHQLLSLKSPSQMFRRSLNNYQFLVVDINYESLGETESIGLVMNFQCENEKGRIITKVRFYEDIFDNSVNIRVEQGKIAFRRFSVASF